MGMTKDNQQERLVRLSYVAGLIAGEGWFGITVQRRTATLQLRPRFAMQMDDTETIRIASDVLKEWEIAHYVTSDGRRIEISGHKRMSAALPVLVPLLTGHKKRVAQIVLDWVQYRDGQSDFCNYTEKDIEFVNAARAMNAGNGKDKLIPTSILRDYTLGTRKKRVKI
jgi:hypothetical protein